LEDSVSNPIKTSIGLRAAERSSKKNRKELGIAQANTRATDSATESKTNQGKIIVACWAMHNQRETKWKTKNQSNSKSIHSM
jgi:hypothetical protein